MHTSQNRLLRPRLVRSIATFALVTSFSPGAALAACCNDVLSCAAAIATGGVSCAIENYLATIQAMVASVKVLENTITRDVNQVIDASRQAVKAAGADLANLVKIAETDFNNSLNQARQIAAAIKTQAVPANASAQAATLHASLKEALPRAQAELEKVKPQQTSHANVVRNAVATAASQLEAQVPAVMNIVKTILLAPLQNLTNILNQLLAHPENLTNPQAIVDSVVLSVTAQMAQTMDSITQQLVNSANATLQVARVPAETAQDQGAWSKQVAAAVQEANTVRTQAALDKLNALLPPVPVTAVGGVQAVGTVATTPVQGTPAGNAAQPAVNPPGNSPSSPVVGTRPNVIRPVPAARNWTAKALAKTEVIRPLGQAAANRWSASLKRDWDILKQKQQPVLHPVLPASVSQSFRSRSDASLGKLDDAQLTAKSTELLAEAQTRYEKDPATLAKIKQVIAQEIERHRKRHGTPVPGPKPPAPPPR